jgi:DNA-binding winged helix-turn-helix (wHTH) protein
VATDPSKRLYRFGIFEADAATGELRRKGVRVRLSAQPFQALLVLLERAGQLVTREELSRALWPDGTFVDFDHGVNSAVNRLREALRDTAANPRFIETLARRGYRFLAPVEIVGGGEQQAFATEANDPGADTPAAEVEQKLPLRERILARPEELPEASHRVVASLFVALQLMYLAFYVGALANLDEIRELMDPLPWAQQLFWLLTLTAAMLIPVRAFTIAIVLFRAPGARAKLLTLWRFLLVADELWALAPFLLLHHINVGLALASATLLVYAPFAERSLVLMGAADRAQS